MSFPQTKSNHWRKPLLTNATSTAYPATVPTTTEPVAAANIIMIDMESMDTHVQIIPFGTDAADEAGAMQVIGWRPIGDLWIPIKIGGWALTLGAQVGVAGELVTDSDYFVDTITDGAGTFLGGYDLVTYEADGLAMVTVLRAGFQKIGIYFDINTASSLSALISTY